MNNFFKFGTVRRILLLTLALSLFIVPSPFQFSSALKIGEYNSKGVIIETPKTSNSNVNYSLVNVNNSQYLNSHNDTFFCWADGTHCSPQTPWTSNIDGAGYNLTNVSTGTFGGLEVNTPAFINVVIPLVVKIVSVF